LPFLITTTTYGRLLAISESYHLSWGNARYDLVIATSRFFSKVLEDSSD
jgi:hypothetical protein